MKNIRVITTKLPFPPYNINSYIINTKRHRILFDTTLNDKEMVDKILFEIEKAGGIDIILLSHGHLDHAGAAGLISKELGTPIYVSFDERDRISNGVCERMERRIVKILKVLDFFGFDSQATEREKEKIAYYKKLLETIDVFFNVNTIKDEDIEIIKLPGHTEGSIGLYLKDEGLLLSGDALLSEGVSAFFDVERLSDTLSEYLSSLDTIEKIKPKKIYPGHFDSFDNVYDIIKCHKNYIAHKSKNIIKMLEEGKKVKDIKEALYPPNQNILIVLAEIIHSLEQKGVPVLKELRQIL